MRNHVVVVLPRATSGDLSLPAQGTGVFLQGKEGGRGAGGLFFVENAAGDRRIIGEASPSYLSCPETPELIRLLCPDAKFVVTVRHPADRAYSLYHFMRAMGVESAQTFAEALRLEPRRLLDEQFRREWSDYFGNCLYFQSGLFGEQAARYLRFFNRSRFYFLTLDRLKREPLLVLREIFTFLGVDGDFVPPDLSRKFTSLFTSRNAALHHWWRQRIWRRYPRARNRWPINALARLEWKYNVCSIPPIDPEIRKKLSDDYRGDLRLFSQLTGLEVDPDGRW
jgi:Sulfotransferase domain